MALFTPLRCFLTTDRLLTYVASQISALVPVRAPDLPHPTFVPRITIVPKFPFIYSSFSPSLWFDLASQVTDVHVSLTTLATAPDGCRDCVESCPNRDRVPNACRECPRAYGHVQAMSLTPLHF